MNGPKIVLWDLETLANLSQVMRVFPRLSDFNGRTLKASINSVICFGYKWLGQKRAKVVSAWDYDNWDRDVNDDYPIVKAAHDILHQCDAMVTHNGKKFDLKFLNTRILYHKKKHKSLKPLIDIKHIDTCQLARHKLFLFSNRLNDVAEFLGCQKKLENGGWDLWVNVLNRHKPSQTLMAKYCKQDVVVLEEVFNKLRGMSLLPNYHLFGSDKNLCNQCGSGELIKWGFYYTKKNRFQRFRCKDCTALIKGNKV